MWMLARCLGRSSVANEKNASTPPLDTRNIGFKSPAEIGNYTRIVPFPQTVNSPQDKIARSLLLVVNYATTERAVYFVFLNSAKTQDAYAYFLYQPLGPVWTMLGSPAARRVRHLDTARKWCNMAYRDSSSPLHSHSRPKYGRPAGDRT